jgi:hypothetical protein
VLAEHHPLALILFDEFSESAHGPALVNLSTGEQQLVQRAAVLGAILVDMEASWLRGERPFDIARLLPAWRLAQ